MAFSGTRRRTWLNFGTLVRVLWSATAATVSRLKKPIAHNVSGVQVHDARLVAAMRVHGVSRILTFNDKDFTRYADIEVVHPRTVPLS